MIDELLNASAKLREDRDEVLKDETLINSFATFVGLVRRLRKECPWDKEQTHLSVKELLIEETYETVEAISSGEVLELRNELGDLLLHVLFHGAIAEESNEFRIEDISLVAVKKLFGRHPHVYGNKEVENTDEVLKNWEQIKMEEGGKKNLLDGVPSSMPGLLRAHRIQEKVAGVGFDFENPNDCWTKVQEELQELRDAIEAGDNTSRKEELGDLLFSIVNYARQTGINSEDAVQKTNAKFSRRFGHVERRVHDSDEILGDVPLAKLDQYWNDAKGLEP